MPFRLRHATDRDADAIAEPFFASYRLLTFLPMLHPIERYRRFVASVLLKECVSPSSRTTPASSRFSPYRAKKYGNSIRDPTASVEERGLSSLRR